MGENRQKWAKIAKMGEYSQKWVKIAKNGRKSPKTDNKTQKIAENILGSTLGC
jgi:hypothetical protein